ncbi:hypothetical protein [Aquipuribacter hungaricus]|uniref:Uncharacterized protein n=1 Tax=Aquipuribacter hungaricus TaxID=545624 RepID=A0ABV7WD86_9MICO
MTGVVAAPLMVAGCGDPTTQAISGAASQPPQTGPAAWGDEVTTRYPVMVIDGGDGAELCPGGVGESLPPQCGGPELIGWDWTDHDGDYESASGVRFGDFQVTGTFDGTDLTVTDAVPADEWTDAGSVTDVDFASPCPEPPGGWPGEPMPWSAEDIVFTAAQQRSDYAGGWVTHRDPRDAYELDRALTDDPEATVLPPVVNIRVTGDPAAAEAELREVWDGPLCVTTAERTETELRRIQDEVTTSVASMLSAGVDVLTGTVQLTVTYDDGALRSELDGRYGDGVVQVISALVLAG